MITYKYNNLNKESMTRAISCALRGRSKGEWYSSEHRQMLEMGTEISNALSSVQKDYMVCMILER